MKALRLHKFIRGGAHNRGGDAEFGEGIVIYHAIVIASPREPRNRLDRLVGEGGNGHFFRTKSSMGILCHDERWKVD